MSKSLLHRPKLRPLKQIAIDEISIGKRHKYGLLPSRLHVVKLGNTVAERFESFLADNDRGSDSLRGR